MNGLQKSSLAVCALIVISSTIYILQYKKIEIFERFAQAICFAVVATFLDNAKSRSIFISSENEFDGVNENTSFNCNL